MRPSSRRVPRVLSLALVSVFVAGVGTVAAEDTPAGTTFVPIGSAYQADTLQLFARAVTTRPDDDPIARILVLPITYSINGLESSKSERKKNLSFADNRRGQVETACNAVKDTDQTCIVELVPSLERSDASDPDVLAYFDDEVDGMYVLGGDQGVALQVVEDTDLEHEMAAAFYAGAVFGGNSAGAAVQSRIMINGYLGGNGPAESLREDVIDVRDDTVDWGNDTTLLPTRGLSFGFANLITDQHVFEYGRTGRSLNVAVEYGLPVLGMDAATAGIVRDFTRLTDVTGDTAAYVIDPNAWGSEAAFGGPNDTLSTRDVALHLLPPGQEFDFTTMQPRTAGGAPVAKPDIAGRSLAGVAGTASTPLYLSGGIAGDPTGAVGSAFIAEAGGAGSRIVVLAAGYAKSADAAKDAKEIAQALAPWVASVDGFTSASKADDVAAALAGATGIIVTGRDRSLVEAQLTDWPSWDLATSRWAAGVPLLADDAVAAVAGSSYAQEAPAADVEAAAIEDAIETTTDAGLALVTGLGVQPRLLPDQHWPQLFALARLGTGDAGSLAIGLDVGTAIRVAGTAAPTVIGDSAAVLVDGRSATVMTGGNGAQGASWLIVDSYVHGETIAP
ncbi:MAG TPA: hypothetical protein VFY23_06405 [Candidatus Limnocylindrales bacterium]|nr:hypothetical protein [Candidatus Limnocylindrales bacterium]